VLGIDEGLHAEAAADIRRDQAQLLLRHLEHEVGERIAHEVRTLRRGVERRAVTRRVVIADRVARLHRVGDDPVVDELERDRARGLREGGVRRLGVAHVVVPVEHHVAGDVRKELRRARRHRLLGGGDRRQPLVFDLDRLGGVARRRERFGDHERHRLADMPHVTDGQHRARRVVPRRPVAIVERRHAGEVAEAVGAHVLAGRDEQHAGHRPRRRRIDPLDPRMRHRRPQHEGPRHPRQDDVVRIAPAAGDEPQILVAPHGLADAEFHSCLQAVSIARLPNGSASVRPGQGAL
jgi:hypothetical protein